MIESNDCLIIIGLTNYTWYHIFFNIVLLSSFIVRSIEYQIIATYHDILNKYWTFCVSSILIIAFEKSLPLALHETVSIFRLHSYGLCSVELHFKQALDLRRLDLEQLIANSIHQRATSILKRCLTRLSNYIRRAFICSICLGIFFYQRIRMILK